MVRETDHDDHIGSAATLSSIALLQERFRQLRKMKELREEKELLRMISEPERRSPPISHVKYESRQTTFSGSRLPRFPPPEPHCQLSLSLWPDSQNKHTGSPKGPSSCLAKSWLTDAPLVCTSAVKRDQNPGASDVDTSLRL